MKPDEKSFCLMHCVLLNCTSSVHSTKEALAHHYATALEKYSKCDNLALEKDLIKHFNHLLHKNSIPVMDSFRINMKIRPSENFWWECWD